MKVETYRLRIGDEWCAASEGCTFDAINPFNGKVWGHLPQASSNDVDAAVFAAKQAFKTIWGQSSGLFRASCLNRLAELLEGEAERMALIETTDNGKVIRETRVQMHFAARNFRYFAGWADKLHGETLPLDRSDLFDYTTRVPRGVAALVTSWNSPIAILANKLAPALSSGCTVVIKPSEMASISTLEIAALCERAGFPPGVVNVLTGDSRVGAALIGHPSVDIVSFTGGTTTGRAIARQAADTLKPVTLELGGKSANIIFDDANIDNAVSGAIAGIFAASGQTCIAGSRLLVQRNIYDEVIRRVCERARRIQLGDPKLDTTEMGPLANESQYTKVIGYIDRAIKDGASLQLGGNTLTAPGLEKGYFIEPTIFSNVSPESELSQQEVFGPVLAILPFDSEDDAIEMANGTEFGLVAGVWTTALARAHRVAEAMDVGSVWVNTYRTNAAQAPFGGVKASGIGRERSHHALDEYLVVKNVMIDLGSEPRDPFVIRTLA